MNWWIAAVVLGAAALLFIAARRRRSDASQRDDAKRGRLVDWRIAAVVALVVVLLFVAARPLRSAASRHNDEAARLDGQTSVLRREISDLSTLETSRERYAATYRLMLDSLPARVDVGGLIETFAELEQRNQVSVTVVDIGAPWAIPPGPGLSVAAQQRVDILLQVAGAEPGLRGFIAGVRELDRIIVLDRIELEWAPAATESPNPLEALRADAADPDRIVARLGGRAFSWSMPFVEGGFRAVAAPPGSSEAREPAPEAVPPREPPPIPGVPDRFAGRNQ